MSVGFIASARPTNEASFCTTCHEMTPHYEVREEGAHPEISYIECHADAGTTERLAHKFTALGEVYADSAGEPRFPMNATGVPDERCLSCHEDGTISPDLPYFDHDTHRAGKACISCHADIGHSVTASALSQAGVLDPHAQARQGSGVRRRSRRRGRQHRRAQDRNVLDVPQHGRHGMHVVPRALSQAGGCLDHLH